MAPSEIVSSPASSSARTMSARSSLYALSACTSARVSDTPSRAYTASQWLIEMSMNLRHSAFVLASPDCSATTCARARSANVGIGIEALLRGLIELFEVGQNLGRVAGLFEVREQHAELRAPVADVVLSDDAVAGLAQHAHHRVADDGAAQMADVHFLREIRRRVVDDHRSSALRDRASAAAWPGSRPPRAAHRSRRMLMKPGPAMSTRSAIPARSSFATTAAASSRGLRPMRFAACITPLA